MNLTVSSPSLSSRFFSPVQKDGERGEPLVSYVFKKSKLNFVNS